MIFDNVSINKTKDDYHYISWSVSVDEENNPDEILDDFHYVMFWSNDPVSGYYTIKNPDGSPVKVDGDTGPLEMEVKHLIKHEDKNVNHYYVVVAYHKTTAGLSYKSKVHYIGDKSNGIHKMMRLGEQMLHNHFTGAPTLVIKKKKYGQKCTNCWSEARQQKIKSNCEVCNGTGFINGYYQPIKTQMSFPSDTSILDPQKDYNSTTKKIQARNTNYPLVSPKDLIVNLNTNKRYIVEVNEPTKLPLMSIYKEPENPGDIAYIKSGVDTIVSQILTIYELPASDQEYYMNYNGIPEDDADFTLPRYTSNQPSGSTPIKIDSGNTISIDFSDDFEINSEGKLALKSPSTVSAEDVMEYGKRESFSNNTQLSFMSNNYVPESGKKITLESISVFVKKSSPGAGIEPAIISVFQDDGNDDSERNVGDGSSVFSDILTDKATQSGDKFYMSKEFTVPNGGVELTTGKTVFVDINTNGNWTFENVDVALHVKVEAVDPVVEPPVNTIVGGREIEYYLTGGFTAPRRLLYESSNVTSQEPTVSTLTAIIVNADSTTPGSEADSATISVMSGDKDLTSQMTIGDGEAKYTGDLFSKADIPEARYNYDKTIKTGNILLTEDKALSVDINPNNNWSIEGLKVTLVIKTETPE